jgi:hypothetical protein
MNNKPMEVRQAQGELMMQARYCYRISAEAGLAQDAETGEKASCLTEIRFMGREPLTNEEYDATEPSMRSILAKQLEINIEHFEPLSIEMYDEEYDAEGEQFEGEMDFGRTTEAEQKEADGGEPENLCDCEMCGAGYPKSDCLVD